MIKHQVYSLGVSKEESLTVHKSCPSHPRHWINYSCMQCQVTICSECKTKGHQSHNTENISSALNRLVPRVKSSLRSLDDEIQKVRAREKMLSVIDGESIWCSPDLVHVTEQDTTEQDPEERGTSTKVHTQSVEKQRSFCENRMENILTKAVFLKASSERALDKMDGPALLYQILNCRLIAKIEKLIVQFRECRYMESSTNHETEMQVSFSDTSCHYTENKESFETSGAKPKISCQMQLPNTKSHVEQDRTGKIQHGEFNKDVDAEANMKQSCFIPVCKKYNVTSLSKADDKQHIKMKPHDSSQMQLCKSEKTKSTIAVPVPEKYYVTSFRNIDKEVAELKFTEQQSKVIRFHGTFGAMCYYDRQLWLPDLIGRIQVFNISGQLQRTIDSQTRGLAFAVHPFTPSHMLLASQKGLFMVDIRQCTTSSCLLQGPVFDVHASGQVIAALSTDLHVFHTTFPPKLSNSINLQQCQPTRVMVQSDMIYVSSVNNAIFVYSLNGQLLHTYGQFGHLQAEKMGYPILCAIDQEGSLLINDFRNNNVKILSKRGGLSSIDDVSVMCPRDLVFVDDEMFLSYQDGQNSCIKKYKILTPGQSTRS